MGSDCYKARVIAVTPSKLLSPHTFMKTLPGKERPHAHGKPGDHQVEPLA